MMNKKQHCLPVACERQVCNICVININICGKTSRTQEKGKVTAEMGGLREEGHEKIGGG